MEEQETRNPQESQVDPEPRPEAASESPGDGEPSGPSTPSADASPQPEEETLESLRRRLDAVVAEKEQQFAAWQRTQADFANYRRRTEQERIELVMTAEAGLIRELLAVLDDLERALTGLPEELRGLTWVEGVVFIERKLRSILDLHGLKPIEALGKEFDPFEHEAVMRDGEPGEATVVTGELQKGYRFHDRVLRPSLVRVGRPSESQSDED